MRSLIVGTAGHIDHGKSSLVLALSGTDPDRLAEEKRRGITIELGFAHLDLGDGLTASFVDVPGHERFVHNMLAGAHGLGALVLVVAADESVMPQTREHFHICRLLGLQRGLVALTKCDLADADTQAVAEQEVRELVAGSFLEGAKVLRVSARSGLGLELLKAELRRLASEAAPPPADGLLRLPVDRVFTLRGFGTVVTGTLVAGRVALGDELQVLPSGRRCRVRGLQVHGQAAESIAAGQRAALNLAGLELDEIGRGDVLAWPDTLQPTSLLDVALTLLPGERPLRDQARVRVHVGSAELLGRVRLLGARELRPGESGLAQLSLERPGVAGRGDRAILRSYSPLRTLGGARVLDPGPPRRRTADRHVLERAAALGEADLAGAAALMADQAGVRGVPARALLGRLTVPAAALRPLLANDARLQWLPESESWIADGALRRLAEATLAFLGSFHRENPLLAGLGREELKGRLFTGAPGGAMERVFSRLVESGALKLSADSVALLGHAVSLTAPEQAAREALLDAALAGGYRGLMTDEGALAGHDARTRERITRLLLSAGELQRVGEDLLVHRRHLESLKLEVRRRWPPGSRLDVGGVKDLTGLSRKYVIPLLEYLDRERITRRSGNDRVVLA